MAKNVKKRNWAFVLYPESAPEDWRDILQSTGLQCAISPLHNMDCDPTGEVKKEHYHIIVCYSGPTSYNVVNSLCESLGQPRPIPLEQIIGMYRYHLHLDNPDKYQYDDNEREFINGFDISSYVELSKGEVNAAKKRIHKLINELDLVEYSDLMDYLLNNEMQLDYDVASSHTIFFDRLLASRRHKVVKGNDDEMM